MSRDMRGHIPRRSPSLAPGMAVGRALEDGKPPFPLLLTLNLRGASSPVNLSSLITGRARTLWPCGHYPKNFPEPYIQPAAQSLLHSSVTRFCDQSTLKDPPRNRMVLTWISETYSSATRSSCISVMEIKRVLSLVRGENHPQPTSRRARRRAMATPKCSAFSNRPPSRNLRAIARYQQSYRHCPRTLELRPGQLQRATWISCPTRLRT